MAFVKIENKTDEAEFIVFPSIFAEFGGKLIVDNVVKVRGRVNARDKFGNPTSDVKLLAETIEVISDEILENYQSTGTTLENPNPSVLKHPPKNKRKERLFILIEDPDNTEILTSIRHLADAHSGLQEVVLVLKDGDEKHPLKMPFKVDVSDNLIQKLQNLVGKANVKLS